MSMDLPEDVAQQGSEGLELPDVTKASALPEDLPIPTHSRLVFPIWNAVDLNFLAHSPSTWL